MTASPLRIQSTYALKPSEIAGYSGIPLIHQFLAWTAGSLRCVRDLFACVHTWGTLVNVKKFLKAVATHPCVDCAQSSCLDLAFHSEGSCSVPLTLQTSVLLLVAMVSVSEVHWPLWCCVLCSVGDSHGGTGHLVVMVVPGCSFNNTAKILVQRDCSKCIHAHTGTCTDNYTLYTVYDQLK